MHVSLLVDIKATSEYGALNHNACHTYPVLWVDFGTTWIYSTLNHSTCHAYPLLVDIEATLLFGALNHSARHLRMGCCIGSGHWAVVDIQSSKTKFER